MTLYELYDLSDLNQIPVYAYPLNTVKSVSTPAAIGINADMLSNIKEEKECLAHELGHCMTGSFYNVHTLETRERMEERANRWAYRHAVPFRQLSEALENGITELWELAEYFDLPETFITKAIAYYHLYVLNM